MTVDLRSHGLAARSMELAEAARVLASGYLVGSSFCASLQKIPGKRRRPRF
jgi:hypothetical protein